MLGLLLAELIAIGDAQTLSLAPFDPGRCIGTTHTPTWLHPFQGVTSGTPIDW